MVQISQAAGQLFNKIDSNQNGVSARELAKLDKDGSGSISAAEAPGLSKSDLKLINKALKDAPKGAGDTILFERKDAGSKAKSDPKEVGFPDKATPVAPAAGKVAGVANGSGYFPDKSEMEGGFLDKQDKPLCTLQDCLDGKSSYVSIALDKKMYENGTVKYGDTFRIPELEKKYGKPIVFKAVDTGSAFEGKGFGKVDVCVRSEEHSYEPTLNGNLTLIKTN